MAFCKYCGANIAEGARFCKVCGKQLVKDIDITPNENIQGQNQETKMEDVSVQNNSVLNASANETIIDGQMGQILKVYNDHFLIETLSDFSDYLDVANKIYDSKGLSEKDYGEFEAFAEVGREIKNAFSDARKELKNAFKDTFPSRSKGPDETKKVIKLNKGYIGDYFSSCSTIEGININEKKRGYIKITNKKGMDMFFFFDGRDIEVKANVADMYSFIGGLIYKLNSEQEVTPINNKADLADNSSNLEVNVNASSGSEAGVSTSSGVSNNKNAESPKDKIEQIRDIKELLDSGVITQQEFEKLKNEIIF